MSQYKKKIKPGLIELDPTQPTIVVHLTNQLLDQHNLDPDGKPTVVSTTAEQRRYKLKTFTATSSIAKFAAAFVSKCELIHESKTKYVEALLVQLQERLKEEEAGGGAREEADEFDRFGESGSPAIVDERERLNSTAPQSFQSSSRGGKAALNSTAPLSVLTRGGRAVSAASEKDEDEEKQPDTPSTPMTPATPLTPVTPKEPRGGRSAVRLKAKDSGSDRNRDEDDNDDRPRTSKRRADESSYSRRAGRGREDDNEEREERKTRDADSRDRLSPTKTGRSSQRDTVDDDDDGRSIRSDSRNSASSTDSNRPPTRKPNPSSFSPQSSSAPSTSLALTRPQRNLPHAQLDDIDSYIEQLYDDIPAKVQASGCLLSLISNPQHLPYFVDSSHAQVLEIVSRVLSEDRKKSNELVLNIMELFYVLSCYSQLHPLVLSNRIGDTSMKVIALELKRYEVRVEEEQNKHKKKLSKEMTNFLSKQSRLLSVCFELLYHLSEDVLIEMKMKQRDLIRTLIHAVERTVTIVSGWPVSAGQVEGLDELTALVLVFLKKLSIFEENKTEMSTYKLCSALGPLLPSGASSGAGSSSAVSGLVQEATLRLLYNLSFDGGERSQMIRCGYVAGCGAVLRRGVRTGELRGDSRRVLSVAVRLLYSVSMDGQWRDSVSSICSELVGDLTQLVVDWPTKHVDVELIALLVNVTFPPSSASASAYSTVLCPVTTDDLHLLMKRAQQSVDPLLLKFLHHLTVHYPELSSSLSRYAADLISLSVKCASSLDLLFDLLGLIAALPSDSTHNYADLLSQYNYLSFLAKLLSSSSEHPDLRLCALGALSTLVSTDASTRRLGSSGALTALLSLADRTDCLDTAVQCMYCLYRIVRWAAGRRLACDSEKGLEVVVGRLEDDVQCVRELALLCCEEMSGESNDWAERIKQVRFEKFNRLWLDRVGGTVTGGRAGKGRGGVVDDCDEYVGARPKTAGKTKMLLRARNGSRRRSRSRSRSSSRSRSPSL